MAIQRHIVGGEMVGGGGDKLSGGEDGLEGWHGGCLKENVMEKASPAWNGLRGLEWIVLILILGLQVVILQRQSRLEGGRGGMRAVALRPESGAVEEAVPEAKTTEQAETAAEAEDGAAWGTFGFPVRFPAWRWGNPWEDFERAWREMGRMFDGADAAGWGGARRRPQMGMRDAGDRYEIWLGPVEEGHAEVEVEGRTVDVRWSRREEGAGRSLREDRVSRFRLPGPAAGGDGAVRTSREGDRLKIEILKPGAAEPGEQENRGDVDEGAEA